MPGLKHFLRSNPTVWRIARFFWRWIKPLKDQPFSALPNFARLLFEWRKYVAAGGVAHLVDFYPCLGDRTSTTSFDPQYFHQAIWGLGQIMTIAPVRHVDIGSDVRWVGTLTCVTHVEFVDIRPLDVDIPNLSCRAGSIVDLPYPTNTLQSVSALHVIEHIGLGRYGDPLDPDGTAKACCELERVLAVGGRLYLSTPIGRPRVQFNGQRVMAIDELRAWLPGLRLVSMALVDNHGRFHPSVEPDQVDFDEKTGLDYALGCFVFEKNAVSGG